MDPIMFRMKFRAWLEEGPQIRKFISDLIIWHINNLTRQIDEFQFLAIEIYPERFEGFMEFLDNLPSDRSLDRVRALWKEYGCTLTEAKCMLSYYLNHRKQMS